MKDIKKYTVVWNDEEGNENRYTCITDTAESASDACFYEEMSDDNGRPVEGREIVRVIEENF